MEKIYVSMCFFLFYVDKGANFLYNKIRGERMENNICKFNQTRSSDLICTDFVYEVAQAQATGSTAREFVLGMVDTGEGTLSCEGKSCALFQGSLFFVPRGARYSIAGDAGLTYFYICFHGRRAEELIARAGLTQQIGTCTAEVQDAARIAQMALDALHRATEENLDLYSESVLLYLLSYLCREKKTHHDLLSKIVATTNDRFSEVDFSLSALAGELGYDAKYLSALFKKKKGIPFTQYLRELRIAHAVFLMEQGVVSVKNIAILAGFGDALYFSKIFKEELGVPPKTYMEKLQKGK